MRPPVRARLLPAALLALSLFACSGLPAPGARGRGADGEPVFVHGMVFGLFARDDAGHAERGLQEIAALGADSISIAIPWVIPDVRATTMAPRADMTPTDAALTSTIRKAHARGLSVMLMPFLYVGEMGEGEWRGTIAPDDWDAWFAAYDEFILHYAGLAGREGVEYYSVGSELCSTETMGDRWHALIDRVRAVYPGRVTYSANWDHRGSLAFADALDVLGMNAYFKLSDTPDASEEDLVRAWGPIRRDIEDWRQSFGKRVLFTEVGYPSRTGASVNPWDYDAEGQPAPEEQARCYRAFRRIWEGDPGLEGVYFYLWWGEGGPADTGYTPRGKPAESVIRKWYAR